MTYPSNTYTLDIHEVADRLGVCDRTVRNRMKRFPNETQALARMIGRRWRFSEAVFTSVLAVPG